MHFMKYIYMHIYFFLSSCSFLLLSFQESDTILDNEDEDSEYESAEENQHSSFSKVRLAILQTCNVMPSGTQDHLRRK